MSNNLSPVATRNMTVTAVNDPPVADNDRYATNEDTPLTVAAATGVLDGDTDVEGTTLTAVLVDNVQHGTLTLNGERVVHVHPGGQLQRDRLVHLPGQRRRRLTSNLATVTLTVNAVNDAPVADNDAYVDERGRLDSPSPPRPACSIGDTDVEGVDPDGRPGR